MKRFLFGFLAVLFLILNTIPYLHILADDMPTNSQYEMLGAYALSTLITSGEATELDFSDYTENDTSFLIDLGEAIFTGDWSGLAEDGLEWLGETADSVYYSYKEYVSQWKSDHLGIMYSNWFPDETIYVGPDDSYSLAKPLRQLFTPRSNSGPTPNPDPDYITLINIANSNQAYGFFWGDLPQYYYGYYRYRVYSYPANLYSWAYQNDFSIITYSNNGFSTDSYVYPLNGIYTLYITSSNNNYIGRIDNITAFQGWLYNDEYNDPRGTAQIRYNSLNSFNSLNASDSQRTPNTSCVYSGSLYEVMSYFCNRFRNINIYVNGVPWSIVGRNEPTYPIVIPDQLTIYNNQPLEYSFPADTHIELPDLTNIIRNAINSSGVVMWSDIADVFVDVNGQTAVAVTKIVRNDYDNLYMEQYPYPAMLVGMTDQTKFNEHLLDDSHAYLSPMGTIVQETVNVLPPELVSVLAIGAILTIFAVIINRLLE